MLSICDPLDYQEVRRIAKVLIRFDKQHFGVHTRDGEMSFCRCESFVRREVGGQILAVVVAGLVTRQGEQADQGETDRHEQDQARPSDDGGTKAPPKPNPHGALGL
jgi:1,2-phenylacetyl-CoA epoxidase PaaB subunit